MKRPEESEDEIVIEHYESPTGGWGSLKSVAKKAEAEGLVASSIWNQLRRQNKPDGVHVRLLFLGEAGEAAPVRILRERRQGDDLGA